VVHIKLCSRGIGRIEGVAKVRGADERVTFVRDRSAPRSTEVEISPSAQGYTITGTLPTPTEVESFRLVEALDVDGANIQAVEDRTHTRSSLTPETVEDADGRHSDLARWLKPQGKPRCA
jgi:hypothetical protein